MKDGYRSLVVWQKAMALARGIYVVAESLPDKERYALADQMRRAAISVPSNIAEGSRRGPKEFAYFLRIAHGSLSELETQALLANDLYENIEIDSVLGLSEEVGKMLYTLIQKADS